MFSSWSLYGNTLQVVCARPSLLCQHTSLWWFCSLDPASLFTCGHFPRCQWISFLPFFLVMNIKCKNNLTHFQKFNLSTVSFQTKDMSFPNTLLCSSICHIGFHFCFLFPWCFYKSSAWYRRTALTFKAGELEYHELDIQNYSFQPEIPNPNIFLRMKPLI